MTGLQRGRAIAVVAAATMGLFVGPAPSSGAAGTACTLVPGKVTVAVVVDSGASIRIDCVTVAPGSTGVQVLAERQQQLGTSPVRYNSGGLLCAIDGAPTSGCGAASGDGAFLYWSYWTANGGGWSYARSGPATRTVRDGDVEGWHFIAGRGTGIDNAPGVDPTSVTFANPPAPSPPPTPPAPPATSPRHSPASPTIGTPPTPVAPGKPAPSPRAGAPGTPSPTDAPGLPAGIEPATTQNTVDGAVPTTSSTTTTATTTTAPGRRSDDAEVAGIAIRRDDTDDGSATLAGLGLAGGAVAIAAAATIVRRRSR